MDFTCLGGWVKLGRLKDEIWLYWNVLPWYSPEWLCFFIYYLGFLYVCLLELYILWWWFVENFQFWQVYNVSVWSVVIAIKDERSTPDHRGSKDWTMQPRQDSGHGGPYFAKTGDGSVQDPVNGLSLERGSFLSVRGFFMVQD